MSQENVEVIRRLYGHLERRDFGANRELFDPQVEYARIGSEVPDFAGEWHGLDEMRTAVMSYLEAWEHYGYKAERFTDLGDEVLVLETHTGRGKHSGLEATHELGNLFTLRDGLIVRWVQYWNPSEAFAAAGLDE
jgi:ketosteroid isomerase-like protein